MNNEIKIDNYTKPLLTIITVCLLIITVQVANINNHPPKPDNNNSIKYILLESGEYHTSNTIDVNIREVGGRSVGWGGPIEVTIK